ncbi:hypothetical protein CFAM422_001544 [Trichoderma lentiforme]|uniref:Uncharacterized protein n=1 Tax=Trichoderma lentiforme TaxID=1567552 RepID=A0A9P5CFZ2_9HYPO|nr:hypothetical protein CFAM422_001544 [Trichoderma lentiforme]
MAWCDGRGGHRCPGPSTHTHSSKECSRPPFRMGPANPVPKPSYIKPAPKESTKSAPRCAGVASFGRREMADQCAVEFGYTRVSKYIGKRVRLASSKAAKILNRQSPTCSHTILVRPNQGTARSQSGQQSTPQGQHPHRSRNISSGRKTPCKREALLSATPARALLVASRRLGWCSATGAAVLNVKQAAVQLAILSGPLRGEGGALNAVDSVVEGKGPVGAQSLASPSMGSRSQSLLCCGVREYKGAVV